jgi:hypothetical protein
MPATQSVTAQKAAHHHTPNSDHIDQPLANPAPSSGNPRLDLAKANAAAAKKRKADDKIASAAAKKHKASIALAEPTSTNSIKCALFDQCTGDY